MRIFHGQKYENAPTYIFQIQFVTTYIGVVCSDLSIINTTLLQTL